MKPRCNLYNLLLALAAFPPVTATATMWYVVMWLAPERNFSVVVGTNIAGPGAEKGCDEVASAMIGKWLAN